MDMDMNMDDVDEQECCKRGKRLFEKSSVIDVQLTSFRSNSIPSPPAPSKQEVMPRTITRELQTLQRPNVAYSFNKRAKAYITTITIPAHSDWTTELHWHETHREFLRIVQGSASVTLGEVTGIYDSSSGVITVERGVLHEWKQDPNSEETLIVEEWTDPADGQKELFFRNLSSSLIDLTAEQPQGQPVPWLPRSLAISLQLFVLFRAYDNYPVLYRGFMMRFVTHLLLLASSLPAAILGIKPVYEEYTPLPGNKED